MPEAERAAATVDGVLDDEVDLVVVGLGGIGSATALYASRLGLGVLGLERFGLHGHDRGASHDHSRIIRRSYHDARYVRLTAAAYDAWREVEAMSGEQCVWTTGGLDLFPPGAAIDASTYVAAMTAEGVPFDVLDGTEVRRRWPTLAVDDGVLALHQADTGIVSPDVAVPLLQRLATGAGARLHGGCRVRELRPRDDGIDVVFEIDEHAGGGRRSVRTRRVVLAVDAWTNELLAPLGAPLPLTVLQQQVSYYDVDDDRDFAIGRLPVWIWMDEPSFYGFPGFGRSGVKIAEDCGGREVTGDTRTTGADPEMLARTDAFSEALFGGRVGPRRHTATCLYTLTPDRDFVLDAVPGHPDVLVALGAAHAFKFVPWFGRTLAAAVAGRPLDQDLSLFTMHREALRHPNGRKAWLV